jgi:hypothetical protein
LRFGTGEADRGRYLTLYDLIVTPFVDSARRFLSALLPRAIDMR